MTTAYQTTSCCNGTVASASPGRVESASVVEQISTAYSPKASEGVTNEHAENAANAFGYTKEELKSVPEGSHTGLSCGNLISSAKTKEGICKGEMVVDLGSGGGINVFLAATKVGPTGKAIGLDISPDMIAVARENAVQKGLKPPHVVFVETSLTKPLPIKSSSADCILSNCVIDLQPLEGTKSVLKEAHRILKPGERIIFNHIVLKKPPPASIKSGLAAYVGCVAGAMFAEEYQVLLQDAGFSNVVLVDEENVDLYFTDMDSSPACSTPSTANPFVNKLDHDVNKWAGSFQIYALKEEEPIQLESLGSMPDVGIAQHSLAQNSVQNSNSPRQPQYPPPPSTFNGSSEGQIDALPPYLVNNPPLYSKAPITDDTKEPSTLSMYFFVLGFFFPPFWLFGALMLIAPLRSPNTLKMGAYPASVFGVWVPKLSTGAWCEENLRTVTQQKAFLAHMRAVELKWAKRCFLALAILVISCSVIGITVLVAPKISE